MIPRERSKARCPREEYALSPRSASGWCGSSRSVAGDVQICEKLRQRRGISRFGQGSRSAPGAGRDHRQARASWLLGRHVTGLSRGRRACPSTSPILVIRPSPLCSAQTRTSPQSPVLMHPGDRGVHRHPPVDAARSLCVRLQRRQHSVPCRPPLMPAVHGLPDPELIRKIPPRNPRPEPEDDALHRRPMGPERHPHRPFTGGSCGSIRATSRP